MDRWLEDQPDALARVLPVRRRPFDRWPQFVIAALDHGVTEQQVIDAIGAWPETWSGKASEHFKRDFDAYTGFLEHEDPRLRRIAMHGRDWASDRVSQKLREEEERGED